MPFAADSASAHERTNQKLRLVVADDHDLVREGLRRIVDNQADMEVVGEATNGMEAVRLVTERGPAILLLDVSMPGMSGVDVARVLRTTVPETRVIAVTRHRESRYVTALLDAGACGYVLKQSPSSELLRAIRSVAAGTPYIDAALRPHQPAVASAVEATSRGRSEVDPAGAAAKAPDDPSSGRPALAAKSTSHS